MTNQESRFPVLITVGVKTPRATNNFFSNNDLMTNQDSKCTNQRVKMSCIDHGLSENPRPT